MSNKLVVIDGNSIFYRSFYALPLLSNSNGEYSNAVYGFAIQIINIIQNIKPTYIVVAFDVSKKTFRNDMFDGYKATRKPMPAELKSQIEPLKKMLKLMNISIAEKEGLEGDDIIGIISKRFLDTETIIVTGDRDSFQLVDETTSVYFTKHGTTEVKIMNPKTLLEEYGVTPSQFIDLKALQGDASDNIPGVAGIGPKTATELIKKYNTLDGIYTHIDEIVGKTKEKLVLGKDMAYLSKKLATIITSGVIDVKLNDLKYDYPFSSAVYDYFKHYEFKSLLKNTKIFDLTLGEKTEVFAQVKKITTVYDLEKLIEQIKTNKCFSIYLANEKASISLGDFEYEIALYNNLLYEGLNEDLFYEKFKEIFEDNNIQKICYDSKMDMYKLKKFNINLENYFDCAIAKYLVDGIPVDSLKDIFYEDDPGLIAFKLFEFYKEYKVKIEEEKLQFLFYNVENKLSKVLFSMENAGFKIDEEILNTLREKYEIEQNKLIEKIYDLAGEEFNVNSPKQLAHILYEKLGLSHSKKQSTSAENLLEIESEHEIVSFILRYRKVTKFLTTYIAGFYPHIDENKKVHTYFKQTYTTTGRLSSVEPNLQNIPIRSEESKEIRSMFVASSKENVLIDADYSQIELRLLAHFSADAEFLDAFNKGEDIHARTASSVFGVPENLVTKEMRRTAKVVNFGIIYGISEYGLAADLHISVRDARAYIKNYYEKHPAVAEFMNKMIKMARETGKASTLFGRTRKMFDINASNFMVRSRAERASQNMPLQGTAADIIKIAMVNTYDALKNGGYKAKLIMQVHDELIVDCPIEEEKEVTELLKEQMINACKLNVPLEVDSVASYRWSDGH